METCRAQFEYLQYLTNKLVNRIEIISSNASQSSRSDEKDSLLVMKMYKGKLDEAVQMDDPELLVRAANGLTSTSKGLGDQGWCSDHKDITELAWEVTKAAIRAAACIRPKG